MTYHEPPTQENPVAILIVPQDRVWNEILATFLASCTMQDLCVHSDSVGPTMKAVAW